MNKEIEQPKLPLVIEVTRGHLIGACIAHGFLGFIGGFLLFYFKSGERSWGTLLGGSAAVALFVALISYFRAGFKKQKRITADERGIQIENESERLVLSWSEIQSVSHWVHGGDYWEFRSANRAQPIVLKGFCFENAQCKQLSAIIGRFKGLSEEQPNLERLLKDALVY